MMKPAFQGDEDPRIAKLDDLGIAIINKVRILQRSGAPDRPRYRQELRQLLQDFVNAAMKLADVLDH
jgi:hypothetical protein